LFKQCFEQTAMDDIASEVGFIRGLLYAVYFSDKKGIYDALGVKTT
jgi:uncharacterized protein YrrD